MLLVIVYSPSILQEIDYKQEADSCNRFGTCFSGGEIPFVICCVDFEWCVVIMMSSPPSMTDKAWVKSPYILWSHSTSKILTMEYIEGIKITDIEKVMVITC